MADVMTVVSVKSTWNLGACRGDDCSGSDGSSVSDRDEGRKDSGFGSTTRNGSDGSTID